VVQQLSAEGAWCGRGACRWWARTSQQAHHPHDPRAAHPLVAPRTKPWRGADVATQVRTLGDAKSSLGDAKSSLGDAKSSLGDAKSSLGGAKSSLGDTG
jgi:hypothetical protein